MGFIVRAQRDLYLCTRPEAFANGFKLPCLRRERLIRYCDSLSMFRNRFWICVYFTQVLQESPLQFPSRLSSFSYNYEFRFALRYSDWKSSKFIHRHGHEIQSFGMASIIVDNILHLEIFNLFPQFSTCQNIFAQWMYSFTGSKVWNE